MSNGGSGCATSPITCRQPGEAGEGWCFDALTLPHQFTYESQLVLCFALCSVLTSAAAGFSVYPRRAEQWETPPTPSPPSPPALT